MSYPRVKSGDSVALSADFLNRVMEVAEQPRGGLRPEMPGFSSPLIKIKNTTASFVPANGILGVGKFVSSSSGQIPSSLLMDFRNGVFPFEGELPKVASHEDKFCIVIGGVAPGEYAEAFVTGVASVKINVTSEAHTHAKIVEDTTANLESTDAGIARIIWKESGTGMKWAAVRLGGGGGGGYPELWKAVTIGTDATITAKRVLQTGDVTGDASTHKVYQNELVSVGDFLIPTKKSDGEECLRKIPVLPKCEYDDTYKTSWLFNTTSAARNVNPVVYTYGLTLQVLTGAYYDTASATWRGYLTTLKINNCGQIVGVFGETSVNLLTFFPCA